MKKIIFLISFFIILSACKGSENKEKLGNTTKKNEQILKRYDVKSGIVHYKTSISGKVMGGSINGEGSQSLYFKDWGALELKEEQSTQTTTVSIMGQSNTDKQSSHIISKLDNGTAYSVNFKNKTIYKMQDPLMQMFKMTNQDAGDVGKKMMEGMGGKMTGTENYQGYNCEIWDLKGIKQWIYKGVTLKIEAELMGVKTVTEATDVQFDIAVPDSHFKLPDFPIVEQEGMMSDNEMKQDMEDLKKDMQDFKKLTFEQWKEMMQKEDADMKNMSDEELKQIYNMMQKMAQ